MRQVYNAELAARSGIQNPYHNSQFTPILTTRNNHNAQPAFQHSRWPTGIHCQSRSSPKISAPQSLRQRLRARKRRGLCSSGNSFGSNRGSPKLLLSSHGISLTRTTGFMSRLGFVINMTTTAHAYTEHFVIYGRGLPQFRETIRENSGGYSRGKITNHRGLTITRENLYAAPTKYKYALLKTIEGFGSHWLVQEHRTTRDSFQIISLYSTLRYAYQANVSPGGYLARLFFLWVTPAL